MISVIIPTCNRNDLLSNCLNELEPGVQSVNEMDYEVIVTDDSKNGNAADLIRTNYTWAKWVQGPKKGPAANRNNGAKHAKGDWLVFIDDDCVPAKDLLNEYLKGIKSNLYSLAFEGAIHPDNWELLKKDMAECPVNTNGGCFWSANICVNTGLFKQLGGFNEQYFLAAQEDQQLKIDIERCNNSKIVFLRNAQVVHPVRFIEFKKKISAIPAVSKNFCLYAYKNRDKLGYNSLFTFFKNQMHLHLKQSLFYLKRRVIKSFLIELIWLCWGVPLNTINYFSLMNTEK